jgi:non-ribosomal peptide synthetase-like protein
VTAFLPGLVMLHTLERRLGAASLLASPVVAASFIALLCLEIVLVKRLVVGRVRAGRYDIWSGFVLRKWLFDRAMALSLEVLGGLYATLFLNPWLRLIGVTVGKNAEVSTAFSIVPDLTHLGDGAFIADCVSLGIPRIARGWVELQDTRIGERAFIGNSAVVGGGVSVGKDSLVGCLSSAPRDPAVSTETGASWFGSPPIALPQRQVSAAFPATETYRPTRKLIAQRLAIEALRVTLPTTCFVALTSLLIDAAIALHARLSLPAFLAVFPLVYVAFGILASLIVIAMKWLLVGRYRTGERPLWSTFVWRTELVTAMHENLADPFFNELLSGTPFAAWFFRALGAKIGRGVYMATTQLTEYDLITVGNDVCLNSDCTLQTHLFEDRVMKVSSVTIGDLCSVGAESVVLYDTQMEPGSQLAPLSLLMKGETLPARSRWEGSPARPTSRASDIVAQDQKRAQSSATLSRPRRLDAYQQ